MSLTVKISDIQYLLGSEVYSNLRRTSSEEQINARLELLGRPEGVNFKEYSKKGRASNFWVIARNVRLIAERLGDNPATKIFLRSYDAKHICYYTLDNQGQLSELKIYDYFCKYSSGENPLLVRDLCEIILRDALEDNNVVEDETFHVTCNVTNLEEVEVIKAFFDDHPDLLPTPIREEVFPVVPPPTDLPEVSPPRFNFFPPTPEQPQHDYAWLYIGSAFLLTLTIISIAKKYLPQGEQTLTHTQKH